MTLKTTHKFLFALLCLFPSLYVLGQSPLRYQMEVGDSYVVKQNARQLMTQKMEGTSHEITNDLEGLFEFRVTKKTEEVYTMDLVFLDFALKSSSSIQGVLMDVRSSKPKEGDVLSSVFSALLNQRLSLEMTRQGKIITVTGGDKLIDNMVNSVEDLDEFSKDLMRKSLEKDFGSEGLAKSFEQMTFFYPENPASSGTTWTTDFQGKISGTTTWTLEKTEEEKTSISGTATISMYNVDNAMTLSLKGTQETLIQASAKNGFLLKMMVSGSGSGTSVMTQMGNVEIPTTLEQTITYELITE